MNRIILPIMALAALTGCSKNGAHTANTDDRVPVRLGAGVEVQAKAPVNTGMSFEAAVAAWETSAPTVDYGAATAWRQTVTITADPTSAQTVVLEPARYYRPDRPSGPISMPGILPVRGTATEPSASTRREEKPIR